MQQPQQFFIGDSDIFPNSILPVLYYEDALELPLLFSAMQVKKLFSKNDWTNNWRNGIFTYHHYHSITHEVMAIIKGHTTLQLGGDYGIQLTIEKGDVLVIPAGVAHKNLGSEKDVIAIGGYPGGRDYDMNYGKPGERPAADENIARLPIPLTDPVLGNVDGVPKIWKGARQRAGRKGA